MNLEKLITSFIALIIFGNFQFVPPCRSEEQPRELKATFLTTPSVIRLEIGTLKARELREFIVRIRNESESGFLPGKVVSSCSCAAATVDSTEVLPGQNVDVRIRIAVPNNAGEFGRRVRVLSAEKERLDTERLEIVLVGNVEMPFTSESTDLAKSDSDGSVVLLLNSNEGALDKDSLKVTSVTPGISVQAAECEGEKCRLVFAVEDTLTSPLATVVVSARNLAGKKFEQQFSLRIRKKQSVMLKPRVLRFKESATDLQCQFFIYGEKDELAQLNLDKLGEVEVIYSDSSADLDASVDRPKITKMRLLDIEVLDYGISGKFVAEHRFSDKGKCFLRLALRSGEFLDQIFVVIFE